MDAPRDRPSAPAFFDEGHDGTWLEALSFAPWTTFLLDDGNRAACNRAFLETRFPHLTANSPGEEQR